MAEPPATLATPLASPQRKIAVYIVAQNAVGSLSGVLERIPPPVRERVTEIFVFDAGSRDDTYLVGVGYKAVSGYSNLTVVRGAAGGAGASNKRAIGYCRERGYDVMVLLHADGKYAPEVIDDLLQPLERGEVDAVVGSRFRDGTRGARAVPFHKWLGIRVLGALQNRLFGLGLADYHCGYRAYSVSAIGALPYEANSDGLPFDTELLAQMRLAGLRIAEVPVPPYSGAETDGLNGVGYAAGVLRVLAQYWLHVKGFREYPKFAVAEKYTYKESPDASHRKILDLVDRDRVPILDVGCGAGYLAEALAVRGNTVVGVDARRPAGVDRRMAKFLQVELDREPITWSGPPFAFVVLADVLEHLRDPEALLVRARELLADGGRLIVSVPNVAHWSVRLPLLFGRFPYAAKGILDRTHLRFYTLASIRAELERLGFTVERVETTVPPLEEILAGPVLGRLARVLTRLQVLGARLWKGLFAYQIVLRARKTA
jgi:2-polyprenyl-3-methyl-5-hydroxy-6-metoxy-1,4-benzoquinol methylase